MTNVHGIQPTGAAGGIEPTGGVTPTRAMPEAEATFDTVEISTAAKLASKVRDVPEVRAGLVARVKSEIEAGTYETAERLDVTISRLMDDLLPGS
jgi:negative regulator of flagellin synthesis FlgM